MKERCWEDRMARTAEGRFVSAMTGSGWERQRLTRTVQGEYYTTKFVFGLSTGRRRWLTHEQAIRWLVSNDHEVPRDLED
jgi:hypothetical protein